MLCGDGLSVDDVEAEGVAEFPGGGFVVLLATFQLVILDEKKPRVKMEREGGRTDVGTATCPNTGRKNARK